MFIVEMVQSEYITVLKVYRVPCTFPGSKLVPFWSWLQMGKDLLFIRLRYITGAWRLENPHKSQ